MMNQKLICNPYVTYHAKKDNYNHIFQANHKVVKGHYLEIFKVKKDGDLYFHMFQCGCFMSRFGYC